MKKLGQSVIILFMKLALFPLQLISYVVLGIEDTKKMNLEFKAMEDEAENYLIKHYSNRGG